jgi:predicted transcriptional regulator of viral defense system
LKRRIEEQGLQVRPSEIYNAIGYLARKQHIQRVGYGRYVIGGIAIVGADEFGGQPAITEGDADD